MESQFIGSMVSVDCGEILGIYQGLLDGIDQSRQMLTIVNAFHNGTRCSVPRITINATDICDLKIIKDVAEAKLIVSATGQRYGRKLADAQTSGSHHQNERHICPPVQDGSIVSFQHSRSDAQTDTSTTASLKDANGATGLKSSAAASPRKSSVKAMSRDFNCRKSQQNIPASTSRSSPYKRQTNGCLQNKSANGASRVKSYETGRVNGHSPNDLSASMQVMSVCDEVNTAECFSEINQGSAMRRRTTSASDVPSVARNGWKGYGGTRYGARGPGIFKEEEDCFAVPIDSIVDDEFDFEKNLALFDKRAVFDKIEKREQACSTTPAAVPGTSSPRPADAKYRCDENVLPGRKAVYRQILVSHPSQDVHVREYVTDSGLVIPSIQPDLRRRLLVAAERDGFDRGRQIEMVGRSAAEMVLQLLGGGNRFDPKNMHQCPRVVVLCGSGSQAAFGVNCARHLSSRCIDLTVFVPDAANLSDSGRVEMNLLECHGHQLTTSDSAGLPTTPVDVIVSALDSNDDVDVSRETWCRSVVEWANANKAPVLSLDPCRHHPAIIAKWSLAVALPLAYDDHCGQIYLCDLGLPARLYHEAGLKTYESPFAHKFVIPLHLR